MIALCMDFQQFPVLSSTELSVGLCGKEFLLTIEKDSGIRKGEVGLGTTA